MVKTMDIDKTNLDHMCARYIGVLNNAPNGLGQHIDSEYGQSHNLLAAIYTMHGKERTNQRIDSIFNTVCDRLEHS